MLGVILAITVNLPFAIASAEEIPLALDEAVAIALRDNREVLLRAEALKKAKAKISEAKAGLLPGLSFTGAWSYAQGYYSKDMGSSSTQIGLKQNLYKGGKILSTIKYSELGVEIAQAVVDKAKLDLILKVEKSFYTLMLSRDLCRVNKLMVDNASQHLAAVKERYLSGEVSSSDLLAMEASLSVVQQAYQESLNQQLLSLALLAAFLNLDPAAGITPQGEFGYDQKELAFDQALVKAMKQRPEIKQYEAESAASRKAVDIARSEGRPAVTAAWDYYSRSHLTGTTSRNWNDNNTLGITFSWPIFDGWLTAAKVQQAIIGVKEAELLKEKNIIDIGVEVKSAYLALKDAISAVKPADLELKLYADNLSVVGERQKNGLASSLDLSDAGLKKEIAVFKQQQVLYDYHIAKSEFEQATGGV